MTRVTFKHMNEVIQGDCLELLKCMPDECVSCIVTSPPYFGHRDYGCKGQLGQEKTIDEYIEAMGRVFYECKRVLRKDGTMWINIGDGYSKSGKGGNQGMYSAEHPNYGSPVCVKELPPKCLLQIPARLAMRLTKQWWMLRNEIIWWKPNQMPQSAKDRFTVDYESLFFFTKSSSYWFNTQYEPSANDETMNRLKRSVWSIPTQRNAELHFAIFPEKLIETPILAGCPEQICTKCNKPREVIWKKKKGIKQADRMAYKLSKRKAGDNLKQINTGPKADQVEQYENIGLTDCGCGAPFTPGVVLDIFAGSGTTGVVARKLGRKFLGFEINPEYCKIANEKIQIYS